MIDPRLFHALRSHLGPDIPVLDAELPVPDHGQVPSASEIAAEISDDDPGVQALREAQNGERTLNEILDGMGVTEEERAAAVDRAAEMSSQFDTVATAARRGVSFSEGGAINVAPELRRAMRQVVNTAPPEDTAYRQIGGGLTLPVEAPGAITETSPFFTTTHWHWLAAHGHIRDIPSGFGPTAKMMMCSEAQVMHDLRAWSALDANGDITAEAEAMFAALTGRAEITLTGLVLLHGQRRSPVEVPAELRGFSLESAVRDVPRVHFIVAVTEREVVSALLNGTTFDITRRLRRASVVRDAAEGLMERLDPQAVWSPFEMPSSITISSAAADALSSDEHAGKLFTRDPDPEDGSAVEEEQRERSEAAKSADQLLVGLHVPKQARQMIAEIAGATTSALAQVTLSTGDREVSRSDPAAIAIAYLQGRGVVVSYPSGRGRHRHITYTPGNRNGIELAITTLRQDFRGA